MLAAFYLKTVIVSEVLFKHCELNILLTYLVVFLTYSLAELFLSICVELFDSKILPSSSWVMLRENSHPLSLFDLL